MMLPRIHIPLLLLLFASASPAVAKSYDLAAAPRNIKPIIYREPVETIQLREGPSSSAPNQAFVSLGLAALLLLLAASLHS